MPLGCSKDEHLFLLPDPVPDRVNGGSVFALIVEKKAVCHVHLGQTKATKKDSVNPRIADFCMVSDNA